VIEGFIGSPGAGKTYGLTLRAIQAAKKGRPVFANYEIDHKGIEFFTAEQFASLPAGLVVLDEAHLWFPARRSMRLPSSWLALMSQTRKQGWDVLWSAQHEARVDRVLKDITTWMWLCRQYSFTKTPWLFHAKSWEPEYFRKDGPDGRGPAIWRRFRPEIANAYRTHGRIEVAAHTKDRDDEYEGAGTW
jgi:hypothetical protein